MPELPILTGREVVQALERDDFFVDRVRGSHHIMKKEGHPYVVTVPVHPGKTIGKGLLRKIIRDAGLTVEEFLALLE